MTNSFVHTDMATEHTGVLRVERAAEHLKTTFGTKGVGASLMLAALVSAVLVVATRLVDSVAGGSHWIAGWALLWAVAFVAIALLAAPARNLSSSLRAARRSWDEGHRRAMEDDKTWQVALQDSRVMADLNRAMSDAAVSFYHKNY
ncbi:MAG: hypothetical protein LBE58_12110 [Comamonas sp.]|jgi:hypothetical protein|uniref:Uncharacterized protein n=1 Tax=Comamonas koreensis TaxID=160825 RepID=A0AAW4XVW1_9BURK|nr:MULTISPECIES: hypothetical protein [Comamonas]MCD2165240.1 hypothetical protein [Comamonas koreensis]MDR0261179.1 hypothetical protein [Comamonas sp.]MDR2330339.1 hypothetical protein [Comamonas sp.]TDS81660.1 hypothetical protein EDF71_109143 [Comamonas sp. JUb58]